MSFRGRVTGYVKNWTTNSKQDKGFGSPVDFDSVEDDNCVTSEMDDSEHLDWHMPVIDLDLPCHLEPSSTPGHFHLYIDAAMTFEQYVDLLTAMVRAGVVEPGYLRAVEIRGYGTLRLPGVYKEEADIVELTKRLLA